jgi:hypothetical protein
MRAFLFGLLIASAIAVSACGQQVTPNPPNAGPGGLAPGQMSVKFDVLAPFNFSSYRYFFVFNTTGNGVTPLTKPWQTNWNGYSFAIEVGGTGGATFAGAWQFVRTPSCPKGCPPGYVQLVTTPSQLQYFPNSNGLGTEFNVVFQPIIANGIATPAPGSTPIPFSPVWLFNAFTTEPNGTSSQLTFVDSLGGSANDTSYVSPSFNINTQFDRTIFASNAGYQIDSAAAIVSVEIANNPQATPAPGVRRATASALPAPAYIRRRP